MSLSIGKEFKKIMEKLNQEKDHLLLLAYFITLVTILSLIHTEIITILAAVIFVLPLRILIRESTKFEEEDYKNKSPIFQNLTKHNFGITAFIFISLPLLHSIFDIGVSWQMFGDMALLITIVSTFVLVWPESFYEKNIYFDRWHLPERLALLICGILVVFNPLFAPLLLLIHNTITNQFQYPKFESFNTTHIMLPYMMILIIGSFGFAGMMIDVTPKAVTFLLLSGFAGMYFYPGVAKLEYGPSYYIKQNNPVFLFANAYKLGWMSFLSERTVSSIVNLGDRMKLLLNLIIVSVEIGTIFMLVSPSVGITFAVLVLFFHLMIFALSGINFWRWMAVDLAIIVGLILATSSIAGIFGQPLWICLFILFVVASPVWMRPKKLGWFDSPYFEYFEIFAQTENGEQIKLNPAVFRPYHDLISYGATGPLHFLTTEPRMTYSLGDIHDTNAFKYFIEIFHLGLEDPENVCQFIECNGDIKYDSKKSDNLEKYLQSFIRYHKNSSTPARPMRFISGPCEFYVAGYKNKKSHISIHNVDRIYVEHVDGLWTKTGFHEIKRNVVLSIDYN